jgi:hypothetical protein
MSGALNQFLHAKYRLFSHPTRVGTFCPNRIVDVDAIVDIEEYKDVPLFLEGQKLVSL